MAKGPRMLSSKRKTMESPAPILEKIKLTSKEIKTFRKEYYEDMFSYRLWPISDDYLEFCADEWVHYAKDNDDILCLDEYRLQKGIDKNTWADWLKRNTKLARAQEFVRDLLAVRRMRGALKGSLYYGAVSIEQPFYDDRHRELAEWRAKLNSKDDRATGNITVEIQQYPNSLLVPEKKDDNE
jgi:hypothetical protein